MTKHLINIVVRGQVKGAGGSDDTDFAFTYPNPISVAQREPWMNSVFDPRDARDFTPLGEDAFALWSNTNGNYYAIIFPSSMDRNGRLMLVINVKGFVAQDGLIVLSTLRSLKDYYNGNKNQINNTIIEAHLLQFENSLIKDNNLLPPSSSNYKGYRVFSNESELSKMFTYPHQREYKDYKCIYFVPNQLVQSNPNFRQITSPIDVMYQIGYIPDGVVLEPSRHAIAEGGTLTIIYKKDGFKDETRKVAITGHYDPLVTYRNSVIDINDAKTAGIRFMRKVVLDFVESDTKKHVSKVSIREKGQQQQQIDTILYVPEDILSVDFTATCTGYHTKEVHLSMSDIVAGRVQIELEPKKKERTITIVLPDGRQCPIKAVVKDTDPLSTYLHNSGGYIEVKNRSYTPNGGNGSDKSIWEKIPNWLLYTVIAAVAALMIFCLWKFWLSTDEIDGENDNVKKEQVDEPKPEAQNQEGFNEADFNADLDYLKQHEQWNKQDLRTDDFKTLIDYISEGQVSQAAAHTYKNNDNVNGHWQGILSIVEQYRNDSQFMSRVADEMRKCCNNECANIEKLHSALDLLSKQNDNHPTRMTEPATTPLMSPSKTHKKADTKPADKPKADTKPADKPRADTKPADKPKADTKPADKPKNDKKPKDD